MNGIMENKIVKIVTQCVDHVFLWSDVFGKVSWDASSEDKRFIAAEKEGKKWKKDAETLGSVHLYKQVWLKSKYFVVM